MDRDNIFRSDEIRDLLYDVSEGDQLADNDEEILHSDDDIYSEDDSDCDPLGDIELSVTNDSTIDVNNDTHCGIRQQGNCNICSWKHDDSFIPKIFDFDKSHCGLTIDTIGLEGKEIDIFHCLFDYDLVAHIAEETNKFANGHINDSLSKFSKVNRWVNTNPDELYCFFGMLLLMPHVKKNTYKLYWSTDILFETPIFGKVFSQDRFLLLMRMIHFDDNSLASGGDKLYKIRTVVESLRRKFSASYSPDKNLVIDESLMLWKGRLAFKQYIPSKRKRFGIKLFVLCDSETGVVLDFLIYTGKGTNYTPDYDSSQISTKVVQTLIQPYLGKNHVLFVDNWYSSTTLFDWLADNDTGACGTIRSNRKGLPCLPNKMQKDESVVRSNEKMLVVRWCDRRNVTMISTVHKYELVESSNRGQTTKKPNLVLDYCKDMGAVDHSDMMISFNDTTRKTTKWYRKLFFHLLDMTVLNSFYMYNLMTVTTKKVTFFEYRTNLIRQILECHHTPKEKRTVPRAIDVNGEAHPLRLTGRHFPRPLPNREGQKRKMQKRCHVCYNTKKQERKRKDTQYECPECNVPLCIYPCFALFHTKKNY